MWPVTVNSNAVGVIGAMLGGGSSAFNGLHGMGVDHVLSARMITSTGHVLDLSPDSDGEEGELFHALCGAGHGLGIITSMQLRAFPVPRLRMTNGQVWQRKLIFSAAAIDVAADLYDQLQPPVPALSPVLIFARSPASSPGKGAPIVVLSVSYFGPSEEAEQAAAVVLASEVEKRAVSAEIVYTPLQHINDAAESHNTHGGFKEYYSCFLQETSSGSIQQAFARFVQFGDEVEDAKPTTTVVVASWNIQAMNENVGHVGSGEAESYFLHRDRGISAHFTPCYSQSTSRAVCDHAGNELLDIFRAVDDGNHKPHAGFINNLRIDQGLDEMYSPDQTARLRRIKQHWDPDNMFWSPVSKSS